MSAPAGDLTWRKSSHSTAQGGDCVEVASFPKAIAVRDSRPREARRDGHVTRVCQSATPPRGVAVILVERKP